MATKKKLLEAAAGSAGGAALNVEDVFSTYLYTGNGSTQTITNGIDLAGEGGLVWVKPRSQAYSHYLYDSERSLIYNLYTNATNGNSTGANDSMDSFNSDGFTITGGANLNLTGVNYASWTFRKAPKFFDVVTYTGTGSAQTISHNLGTTPAVVIVKMTSNIGGWFVYHSSVGATKYLRLETTGAAITNSTIWNDTAPTDTQFTVGTSGGVNQSGGTYVAYLFAHNDGDGDFGDGTQDIIKCGSYTGNGGVQSINLGWEPQWLLIKASSATQDWVIYDSMRGVTDSASDVLFANNSNAGVYATSHPTRLDPTGFTHMDGRYAVNGSSVNYIYIAIRRGPMAVPESATDVFAIDTGSTNDPAFDSGFPVDFAIMTEKTSNTDRDVATRMLQGSGLKTNSTAAEVAGYSNFVFDFMNGWDTASYSTNSLSWMWKRAPSFMDVVGYTATNTYGQRIKHNLGVVPEMIWIKNRSSSYDWACWHKDLNNGVNAEDYYIRLNNTAAEINSPYVFGGYNSYYPTSEDFEVGLDWRSARGTDKFIAYLFASLDGVSKVGSYTGNGGSSQDINCGFSSGARFVLVKAASGVGDWWMWDTTRGITAGNDSSMRLNYAAAEVTSLDFIDPLSSGFTVVGSDSSRNGSGIRYIYYAIA